MKSGSIFENVSQRIHSISRWWIVAIATAVFAVFIGVVLPSQAAIAEEETGAGPSPDSSFFYTPADLYEMAESYGEAGRAAYIRARFTFDLVWPLAYLFFLATTLSLLLRHAFRSPSRMQTANLLPLFGALFDYLENIGAALVMARYPQTTIIVDLLTPIFTMLKWVAIGGSFALLLVAAILAVWRRLSGRPA
jgi:hypothetical protein